MGTSSLRARVALLYRRAGFGASPQELDQAAAAGFDATVERLLDFRRPDPVADGLTFPDLPTYPPPADSLPADPAARAAALTQAQRAASAASDQLSLWWLDRMVTTSSPLREKLALFWHGHFATSVQKVIDPGYMYGQNQIFRTMGAGNFADLTLAVSKDPAMLIWLDANSDRRGSPNENFARELLELFTLGIGHYSEADIKEAARAFTGWQLNATTRTFSFSAAQHDTGTKTFLGQTGAFAGEDIVRIATGQPEAAQFVVQKLWSHFATPVTFDDPIVRTLTEGFATDHDIGNLLRAIFKNPAFTAPTVQTGLVKQPIEYLAGMLRALRLRAQGNTAWLSTLAGLGQAPFAPPNVGGWPQNAYWLNSSTALQRLRLAATVVAKADLAPIASEPVTRRPEAAARLLGMVGGWRVPTSKALSRVASEPAAMMTLALVSPEYVMA